VETIDQTNLRPTAVSFLKRKPLALLRLFELPLAVLVPAVSVKRMHPVAMMTESARRALSGQRPGWILEHDFKK
jgi:hypothetical protein